eukprot:6211969-Pleurochrysis_carterae.AAC.2
MMMLRMCAQVPGVPLRMWVRARSTLARAMFARATLFSSEAEPYTSEYRVLLARCFRSCQRAMIFCPTSTSKGLRDCR